ncbi:MAG: hypothetical protein PHI68_05045 [Candidatus Cloacimonetes bacterium]|nr:hypothetical protein [Candidatus Cloacimonadota bacterium]
MNPYFKIALAILLLLAFIAGFCVWQLDNTQLQLVAFSLLSILHLSCAGARKYAQEVLNLLPFILLLMGVYALFGILALPAYSGEQPELSYLRYWLGFGLSRVLLLLSTILLIRIIFLWFRVQDLWALKLKMRYLKYLILARILYHYAFGKPEEIATFLDAIPGNQGSKRTLKTRFKKKLVTILSLLIVVIMESQLKGELIDNRIRHCHRRNLP